MKAIRILEAGPLATIQDLGRYGYQDRGVPVSGAMDRQALRIGNLLVGNAEDAAGIEVTFGGFKAEFLSDTPFAVTGADQKARLNAAPITNWSCHGAEAGDILTLEFPTIGCRTYVALSGGVDVAVVMGSRSTYLRGGFGGFHGRALQQGDVLDRGAVAGRPIEHIPAKYIPRYLEEPTLRVVPGPQDDCITDEGMAAFLSHPYEVTRRSDRMGCALSGPEIQHRAGADIISDGIVSGSVQVPGNRQPIVLMADAQTTGGYVKIATVASFDLPLAAQVLPGSRVRFEAISLLEARALHLKQEYFFRNLIDGRTSKRSKSGA
ncbi:MAG: biotin-dependent carboxyltransferase family protein [Syntrophobacteraceae bacterium]